MTPPDENATQSFSDSPASQTRMQDPASAGKVRSGGSTVVETTEPQQLGRYKILRTLGSGGFGVVYLGFDGDLERVVAIKVPRRERIAQPEQVEAYLAEARVVASLEHPAIVRVYDCGRTDDLRCFVVSQYIDGGDLADWLKGNRAEFTWAAEIAIRIAEALHHAHKSRIVHRDVKPSNILLDGAGTPYLADFGLAMREQDFGQGSGYAGTPRYMSPEQARGEGHRVDGRSDIYSLGVMLYELLSGRVPFVSESITELLEQIQVREPPPMRLAVEHVPVELDRIVTKSLAKRATDRYATAADFADDLRHWLDNERRRPLAPSPSGSAVETPGSFATPNQGETRPPRVVPKGLRAFDANDADFFLKLIPGPRDRDGLPDSLRFWKRRLETRDETFSVGLLYGPSGCGKSSFVRAGLLPRLSNTIHAIYIEATPDTTEDKILAALKKHRSDFAREPSLGDLMTKLRRQPQGPILIVIDQFEQWLSAHPDVDNAALTAALRQCDGVNIQALLLVRDDFWMAATRFFKALEISLQEGQNSAAVDLFDTAHARKVLAGFGRAYGKLPARRTDYTAANNQFLDRAVSGLANADGRIVCVRLALFADMVKGKPWEPATLDSIGGLDGVGTAFLEDTFGASAPPSHKYHQQAARNVLAALLPPLGTEIKKTMAPRESLLKASGYEARPKDFDELLKILDSELRLVTPAESTENVGEHYQLTHDFLVPSLRDWLTRKQKETAKGRAELLLAERAALWQLKPSRRFQPSMLEWLAIRRHTFAKHWNDVERRMMQATGRFHIARAAIIATLIIGIAGSIYALNVSARRERERAQAEALVKRIEFASPGTLPLLVEEYGRYRDTTESVLKAEIDRVGNPVQKMQLLIAHNANNPSNLAAIINDLPSDDPLRAAGLIVILRHPCDPASAAKLLIKEPPSGVPELVTHLASAPGSKEALTNELAKQITKPETEDAVERLKVALLAVNDQDPFWNDFRSAARRDEHANLIHTATMFQLNPNQILLAFERETAPAARRAAVLMLGLRAQALPEAIPRLIAAYRTDNDPGVHAALDWLLRRWGQDLKPIDAELAGRSGPGWSVGQKTKGAFTVFNQPPYRFRMGDAASDRSADVNVHTRTIARGFMIANKEVTAREMIDLIPKYRNNWEKNKLYSESLESPATILSWEDAAVYCNALSSLENLALCYDIELDDRGVITHCQPVEGFLELDGYRLPTETEWEYAARAGSDAPRHFGRRESLLPHYAWFNQNSKDKLHHVGTRLPNEYGLFDMLGNASEWCMNSYDSKFTDYPADGLVTDQWSKLDSRFDLNPPLSRIIRGGSFDAALRDVRTARRFAQPPKFTVLSTGFRVARTLPKPQQ